MLRNLPIPGKLWIIQENVLIEQLHSIFNIYVLDVCK